jgi:hypothetical protein
MTTTPTTTPAHDDISYPETVAALPGPEQSPA